MYGKVRAGALSVVRMKGKTAGAFRIYIAVYPVHVGQEQGLAMT